MNFIQILGKRQVNKIGHFIFCALTKGYNNVHIYVLGVHYFIKVLTYISDLVTVFVLVIKTFCLHIGTHKVCINPL